LLGQEVVHELSDRCQGSEEPVNQPSRTLLRPPMEAVFKPSSWRRFPKEPVPGVRRASDLLRTVPRRSTTTRWNSKELRRAISLRFQALVELINRPLKRLRVPKNSSPSRWSSELRGTRQRTIGSPQDSEESMGECHARVRAPENPAPNLQQAAGLRGDF